MGHPAVPPFTRLPWSPCPAFRPPRDRSSEQRDGGSEACPSPANRRRSDYFFLAVFFFAAGFLAAGFFAAGFFFAVLRTALANVVLLIHA